MTNTSRSLSYRSFGGIEGRPSKVFLPRSVGEALGVFHGQDTSFLGFGRGRSYGDCCLNHEGTLIDTQHLNAVEFFHVEDGVIECSAGVTLGEILDRVVPKGWFVPVVPSTKQITVGGAIANDIHGRDHHIQGSFGCHVESLDIVRSDGRVLTCSRSNNQELFFATLGGIGLTGLILKARFRLKKVSSSYLQFKRVPFQTLQEGIHLLNSHSEFTYLTAWLDGLGGRRAFERGYVMGASETRDRGYSLGASRVKVGVPFPMPDFFLNDWNVSILNRLILWRNRTIACGTQHYEAALYQLDGIKNWNYFYGKKGIVQYHFVLPKGAIELLFEVFDRIRHSGIGPYFSILKPFGNKTSGGLMSFPMEGYMVALDFARRRHPENLLRELDKIVIKGAGRVYAAKDSCLNSESFAKMYPRLGEFLNYIDPKFSSNLWRRVRGAA